MATNLFGPGQRSGSNHKQSTDATDGADCCAYQGKTHTGRGYFGEVEPAAIYQSAMRMLWADDFSNC
ncbi:MAG: hypothetical protein MUD01_15565 [Chloroflexaceae bacterium]|nr:hypothetical protein [Chloroflexaceae bacterium]